MVERMRAEAHSMRGCDSEYSDSETVLLERADSGR
jgi:hypothetical protein